MNLILRLIWVIIRFKHDKNFNITDKLVSKHIVSPLDLDLNLHMNNGKYLSVMDLGRIAFMKKLGIFRKVLKRGWLPIIGSASINFKRSLNVFDRFELHTQVVWWDQKWIYVRQEFKRKGEVIASAVNRGLIVDRNGRKVTTPELLKLAGFEDIKYEEKPAIVERLEQSSILLVIDEIE